LQHGAKLVLEVRPDSRTIAAFDARGERVFSESEMFEHPALDGFPFSIAEFFAEEDLTP
jgi:hypothetical protein